MPHKHKRRKNDSSIYDLPPTMIAKPLPVRDPNSNKSKNKKKSKDGKNDPTTKSTSFAKPALEDDTPKAFRRLMQFQTHSKKRKRDEDTPAASTESKPNPPAKTQTQGKPHILPGEKLSDFAARVDREMPISGMARTGKPSAQVPGMREERRTKHEKHLRRLQAQWRKEDVEIREREAAEREERGAEMEEQLDLWRQWEVEAGEGKAKKKGGKSKKMKKKKGKDGDGPDEDDDPDPWAKLKKKRDAGNKVNPLDVVQAPPQLTKPKEVFKIRGGAKVDVANVPAAVGSLRRREELASERRTIVEEYRRLMAEKRR